MSNNIYDKYNVNISYLKRDYLKNPLNIKINGKGSENTKHYNNAINVWTIRDPLKRKTAKDNGLNWIEFFNMNDFEHWISVLI